MFRCLKAVVTAYLIYWLVMHPAEVGRFIRAVKQAMTS